MGVNVMQTGKSTSFYLDTGLIGKLNEIVNVGGFRSRSECISYLIQNYDTPREVSSIEVIQEQLAELKEILLNASISSNDGEYQNNIERAISIVDDIWE